MALTRADRLLYETMHRMAHILMVTFCVALGGSLAAQELSPLGRVVLDWRVPNVSRVISVNTDFHSGLKVQTASRQGRVVERGGRRCVRAPYLLFDVDDDFAFDIDERITVDILVDREDTDGFYLSYDHATLVPFSVKHRVEPGGKRFAWERLIIERARFANRRYEGADFSIAALGTILFSPLLEQGVFALLDNGASRNAEFTLCGVRLTRSYASPARENSGTVRLALRDETGAPVPARVGLYDASGWSPLPSQRALSVDRYGADFKTLPLIDGQERWPGSGRYVFFVDGDYDAQIPAGEYQLIVSRGPETRIVKHNLTVYSAQTTGVDLTLKRWIDMAQQGWYSGDEHIHIARSANNDARFAMLMRAEDLRVANLLQLGSPDSEFFKQYAFAANALLVADEVLHVPGQEATRSATTVALNMRQLTGAAQAGLNRAEGRHVGLVQSQQPGPAIGSVAALEIALGGIDSMEILKYGVLDTEVYYDFLNMGFKLVPTSGSHFPFMNLPGTERSYVQVRSDFSADGWFAGLRAGQTFVSNGPMLSLDVHSAGMGNSLAVDQGARLQIKAGARVNPDLDRLDRLELIVHGDVVAVVSAFDQSSELSLNHELTVEEGVWIAVRASGAAGTLAHSAPVYITLRGEGGRFAKRAALARLVAKYRGKLGEMLARSAQQPGFEDIDANSPVQALSVGLQRVHKAVTALDALLTVYAVEP